MSLLQDRAQRQQGTSDRVPQDAAQRRQKEPAKIPYDQSLDDMYFSLNQDGVLETGDGRIITPEEAHTIQQKYKHIDKFAKLSSLVHDAHSFKLGPKGLLHDGTGQIISKDKAHARIQKFSHLDRFKKLTGVVDQVSNAETIQTHKSYKIIDYKPGKTYPIPRTRGDNKRRYVSSNPQPADVSSGDFKSLNLIEHKGKYYTPQGKLVTRDQANILVQQVRESSDAATRNIQSLKPSYTAYKYAYTTDTSKLYAARDTAARLLASFGNSEIDAERKQQAEHRDTASKIKSTVPQGRYAHSDDRYKRAAGSTDRRIDELRQSLGGYRTFGNRFVYRRDEFKSLKDADPLTTLAAKHTFILSQEKIQTAIEKLRVTTAGHYAAAQKSGYAQFKLNAARQSATSAKNAQSFAIKARDAYSKNPVTYSNVIKKEKFATGGSAPTTAAQTKAQLKYVGPLNIDPSPRLKQANLDNIKAGHLSPLHRLAGVVLSTPAVLAPKVIPQPEPNKQDSPYFSVLLQEAQTKANRQKTEEELKHRKDNAALYALTDFFESNIGKPIPTRDQLTKHLTDKGIKITPDAKSAIIKYGTIHGPIDKLIPVINKPYAYEGPKQPAPKKEHTPSSWITDFSTSLPTGFSTNLYDYATFPNFIHDTIEEYKETTYGDVGKFLLDSVDSVANSESSKDLRNWIKEQQLPILDQTLITPQPQPIDLRPDSETTGYKYKKGAESIFNPKEDSAYRTLIPDLFAGKLPDLTDPKVAGEIAGGLALDVAVAVGTFGVGTAIKKGVKETIAVLRIQKPTIIGTPKFVDVPQTISKSLTIGTRALITKHYTKLGPKYSIGYNPKHLPKLSEYSLGDVASAGTRTVSDIASGSGLEKQIYTSAKSLDHFEATKQISHATRKRIETGSNVFELVHGQKFPVATFDDAIIAGFTPEQTSHVKQVIISAKKNIDEIHGSVSTLIHTPDTKHLIGVFKQAGDIDITQAVIVKKAQKIFKDIKDPDKRKKAIMEYEHSEGLKLMDKFVRNFPTKPGQTITVTGRTSKGNIGLHLVDASGKSSKKLEIVMTAGKNTDLYANSAVSRGTRILGKKSSGKVDVTKDNVPLANQSDQFASNMKTTLSLQRDLTDISKVTVGPDVGRNKDILRVYITAKQAGLKNKKIDRAAEEFRDAHKDVFKNIDLNDVEPIRVNIPLNQKSNLPAITSESIKPASNIIGTAATPKSPAAIISSSKDTPSIKQSSIIESSRPSIKQSSIIESSRPSASRSSTPSIIESSRPSIAGSSRPSIKQASRSSTPSIIESSRPSIIESSRTPSRPSASSSYRISTPSKRTGFRSSIRIPTSTPSIITPYPPSRPPTKPPTKPPTTPPRLPPIIPGHPTDIITTTKPKPKAVFWLDFKNTPEPEKRIKRKPRDFIGNVPHDKIIGVYARKETTYGASNVIKHKKRDIQKRKQSGLGIFITHKSKKRKSRIVI